MVSETLRNRRIGSFYAGTDQQNFDFTGDRRIGSFYAGADQQDFDFNRGNRRIGSFHAEVDQQDRDIRGIDAADP